MAGYFYVLGTIIFTVYGQIVLKWRLDSLGELPISWYAKIKFLLNALFDPYIFSGFLAAFIASLCWMAAMTKFEISRIYPFMSLAPALVMFLGIYFLGETFTAGKVFGLIIIAVGVFVTVKF